MLDMSLLGYPKTALPFNIFSDNTGFTTTEFEKKQYLLLNLQDRLERTLKDMSGISNAIVTLNVSDDSIYVWDEQSSDSTGSVSLTLVPSYELSPEKVAAIKKLVANSVPRLLPENVAVINAVTMEELQGQSLDSGSYYGLDRLDFESKVEKRLEDKIMNVLTLAYKPSQIRVSATVVIDYDKMITENMQYVPPGKRQRGCGKVGRKQIPGLYPGGRAEWPERKIIPIFLLTGRRTADRAGRSRRSITITWIIWWDILSSR